MPTMDGNGNDGTLNWGGKPNFTHEERVANGRKGAKKRDENRAKRRRTAEILEIFLAMPIKNKKLYDIDQIMAFEKLQDKNITVAEAIQLKQVMKALNGNLNSAMYIRDTVGEKPVEKVEAKVENPFKNLTTEELREIVKRDSEIDNQ